jgi:hypothetical protein
MSIRLSLPSAKNASDWLSGDQNGKEAPSVPVKGCGHDVKGSHPQPPVPVSGGGKHDTTAVR